MPQTAAAGTCALFAGERNPSYPGHEDLPSAIVDRGQVGTQFIGVRPSREGLVQVLNYIRNARKTWLAPLIIAVIIFAALFVLTGGSIDIPFLYSRTK